MSFFYLKFYGELAKDIKHGSKVIGYYFRKATFCCIELIEFLKNENQDQKQKNMTNRPKREMTKSESKHQL